jgi:hypothetical protein
LKRPGREKSVAAGEVLTAYRRAAHQLDAAPRPSRRAISSSNSFSDEAKTP